MKALFRVVISTLVLSSSSIFSSNMYTLEEWPMERFHSSTFFSIIWNTQNPELVFVAASEGALDKNGDPIDPNELIRRYGGHWQMSDLVDRNIFGQRSDWRGGGIRLSEDGGYSIFHKSRGLNGDKFGEGTLDPKLEPIIEEVINNRLPKIIESKTNVDCAELFDQVLNS